MPSPDVLPDELEALAYLNAMRLRPDPDFTADVARLIAGIAAANRSDPLHCRIADDTRRGSLNGFFAAGRMIPVPLSELLS